MPSATSVSMETVPWRAWRTAARRKIPPAQNCTTVAGMRSSQLSCGHGHAQRVRPQHQGHDRKRHRDRDQRAHAQVAHLAGTQIRIRVGVVERQGPGGVRALRPHIVAGRLDGGLHLGPAGHGRINEDGRTFGGEVDVGPGHAVGVAQEALDAVDAGGAGHALDADRELDGLGCRRGHGAV